MRRYGMATVALVTGMLGIGGAVHADGDAAKRQLQEVYVSKFECTGAGQGSARCQALETAYAAAGFGDLAADAGGSLTLTAYGRFGNAYTVTSPAGRLTLTICGFPAGTDLAALFGLNTDLPYEQLEFQVPQIRSIDSNRCVTFTAPFTTHNYLTGHVITVESFASRTWLLEARTGSTGYDGVRFAIP